MSKSSVQQVIQRAVSDAAFRRQLQREPAKALAGFDLTAEERASIAGGDPARLTALGVDQRMSKAFALGAAADASNPVADSVIDSAGGAGTNVQDAFIDEGGLAGSNTLDSLIGTNTSGASSVFASDPTSGATGVNESTTADTAGAATNTADSMTGTDGAQFDAGLVGDTTSGAAAVIPGDPTVGAAAFEGQDTTGDMNVIDPGVMSSSTAQIAGTQVTIDDGQSAFEPEGSSEFSASQATSSGDDLGVENSINPMPTYDGHVTIDDGGDSLTSQ